MSRIFAIEIPKWGLSMEEGTLSRWLIAEGDAFKAHQELCEIETSKIANMLEAPQDGVLRKVVAQPGQTLPVGGLLGVAAPADIPDTEIEAFIAQRGRPTSAPPPTTDSSPAPAAAAPSTPATPAAASCTLPAAPVPCAPTAATGEARIPPALLGQTDETSVQATSHALRLARELGVDLGKITGSGRDGRISQQNLEDAILAQGGQLPRRTPIQRSLKPPRSKADDSLISATPLARRRATVLGINLHDCRASGARGRVCLADVEAAQHAHQQGAAAAAPQAANTGVTTPAFEVQRLSAMRRAIAQRLQESKRNAPHYRLTIDLDLESLLALRQEINASIPRVKVSVNDLLIKACAQALIRVPAVNVQYDEATQSIHQYADADVSVAVALADGLITPIVRAANRKSIAEISEEMHRLATKAKAGTLKPEEFQGGTFSLSNLGMLGVRQFDAIINPPQAAILAIGSSEQRVVAHEGQMAIRQQVTVSLSCDHRVIDGALGAAFLRELKRLVQTPVLMLV